MAGHSPRRNWHGVALPGREIKKVTFEPGPHGLTFSQRVGTVIRVEGQAENAGVEPGWILLAPEYQSDLSEMWELKSLGYSMSSKQRLEVATKRGTPYEVIFQTDKKSMEQKRQEFQDGGVFVINDARRELAFFDREAPGGDGFEHSSAHSQVIKECRWDYDLERCTGGSVQGGNIRMNSGTIQGLNAFSEKLRAITPFGFDSMSPEAKEAAIKRVPWAQGPWAGVGLGGNPCSDEFKKATVYNEGHKQAELKELLETLGYGLHQL